MMSAAAFLVNYGGKVLTNPVSHRVLKNMVDANLPETIRLANFARLVRMYPEEWMAFDQDLAELEMQQKKYNRSSMVDQRAQTTKEKIMEGAGQVIDRVKELPSQIYESPLNPKIQDLIPNKPAPSGTDFAPDAVDATPYNSASAGSSIMNSQTMNPGAAQALYTGNTDAALAAQYGGTQYAAGGGLMEMNPVMNNQGKYTDIQKGINDNPFTKQGIGSLV
jgi:hypothetical protein